MNIIGIDIGNHSTKLYSLSGRDMNIIEGTVARYIPTAISFDNILNCRYFADESMIKLISCSTTLTNLSSKLFDYKRTVIFDKNKYVLSGQYIYIMYINYIYNHIYNHLVEKEIINTRNSIYVIPFPDYYKFGEVNKLINSYKYSLFNKSTVYYIPHSIAIGLEYGLYKAYKHAFMKDTNILFIDIGHINISFYVIRYNKLSMTVERNWVLQNRGADYLDKMLLDSISIELPNINKITEKVLKKILINMEGIRKNLNMYETTVLHIDALYDDFDLNIEIKKKEYLLLYDDVLLNFKNIIQVLINNYDISSIELLGGFSYYNIFKNIIEGIICNKITVNRSLKAEETIARGSCLYGSVTSPIYKNIQYTINYKYPYCICVIIDNDKRILFENEILPFNKDITKKYDGNKPRLVNKNICIQIYILEDVDKSILPKPIYSIKHKASSLINKLFINLIIGLDLCVKVNHLSYTTTMRKKYNITWDEHPINMDTYIKYNDILTKYDINYKNKMKLINTFEEYIYNIDPEKKYELTKIKPRLFDELEEWLMYLVPKLTYTECIDKIEYFTRHMKC